jgi:16S rRNA (uracil1498-N3)-methyltransferase
VAHVFVADLAAPVLDDEDHHHLRRVLRVRVGDEVTASDGAGGWRPCRLGQGPALEPAGAVLQVDRSTPTITIAFALLKGERPELAVQKLTELGVDVIVPFLAERSVVRWDDARAARHVARLRKVAREASMQCRRVHLPELREVATFAQASALPGAAMADVEGAPPSLTHPTLLIGPEGGWSAAESAAGLARVALGPHVLRAETAAITAAALLTALRGGLVGPIA